MKKLQLIALFLLMVFASCSSSSDDMGFEMSEMEKEEVVVDPNASLKGDFVNGAHPTSGVATVNEGKTILSFTNFKTDNGPKLLVYLSTDKSSTEFINLGALQGVQGDFDYNIPSNTDLAKYKLVNIWCVDFSVSFGTAELK